MESLSKSVSMVQVKNHHVAFPLQRTVARRVLLTNYQPRLDYKKSRRVPYELCENEKKLDMAALSQQCLNTQEQAVFS